MTAMSAASGDSGSIILLILYPRQLHRVICLVAVIVVKRGRFEKSGGDREIKQKRACRRDHFPKPPSQAIGWARRKLAPIGNTRMRVPDATTSPGVLRSRLQA